MLGRITNLETGHYVVHRFRSSHPIAAHSFARLRRWDRNFKFAALGRPQGRKELVDLGADPRRHGAQILGDRLITRGILNSSLVHPREVFRAAIAEAAAGIIVVHNHPSGDPTPSADDRAVTRQLVEAGRLLDLPVYDHVIVGGDRYVSFAEAGLL